MSFLNALLNNETIDFLRYQTALPDFNLSSPYAGIYSFKHKNSNASTKSIVLSCAVHGNETAPIELIDLLLTEILEKHTNLIHNVLIIFGNIPAMLEEKRFIDFNLNRLFSNEYINLSDEVIEKKMAKNISEAIKEFYDTSTGEKFHLDLHTAIRGSHIEKFVMLPSEAGDGPNYSFINFLADCDSSAIVFTTEKISTLSNHCFFEFGAQAATIELGKVKPFGQNDFVKLKKIHHTLKSLLAGTYKFKEDKALDQLTLYKVEKNIIKTDESFTLNFPENIKNFTKFAKNSILASDSSTEFKSSNDFESVLFPNNNVKVGQRALYTIVPFKLC
jgi:succinylglutamate desuccinylase